MDDIIACERRAWDALVSGDEAADAALLHVAFIGVYPNGFADRAAHSGQLDKGPSVQTYALHDIRTERLGSTYALICYRAEFRRPSRNTTEVMYVSSIWRRQVDGWINIFSQDTPAA